MKLSIGMISAELQELGCQCYFHGYDSRLLLDRVVFYDGELVLHADTLYLFTERIADILWESLSIEEGTAVIAFGNMSEQQVPEKIALLLLPDESDRILSLSNKINWIFEKYRRIDETLRLASQNLDTMDRFIKLATPLFGNEITLRDKNHRFVAQSYPTIHYSVASGEEQPDEQGFVSTEEIENLKNEPGYLEERRTKRPWIYERDGYRLLCYDLFDGDEFVYRIKLSDTEQKLRDFDLELMEYFVELVRRKYEYLKGHMEEQNEELKQVMQELLSGERQISDTSLKMAAKSLKWGEKDQYLCLCLYPGISKGEIKAYSYYCRYMNKKYPELYALEYKGYIAVIVNLSIAPEKKSKFMDKITSFLRDENFRMGMSYTFEGLECAAVYYHQAQIALTIGVDKKPYLWKYAFGDYRAFYLKECVKREFPDLWTIAPELYQLVETDQKRNTEYRKTLYMYLDNGKNLAKASKNLHINRSTLSYRLGKIEEIMHEKIDGNSNIPFWHFMLSVIDENDELEKKN